MKCKYCSQACVKAGFQKNGNQKYRCKTCHKYQQKSYTYSACAISDPYHQFVRLHNEGLGIRSLSRILQISTNTVLRWKLKIAKRIYAPNDIKIGHSYQVDELHTYVGSKKNAVWVKYIFNNTTKEIVDFKIGARTKERLSDLLKEVLNHNPIRIGTDGLISYKAIIPNTIHKVGLTYTRHIERFNLNLRMHIKYLSRKTICYAKNIKMLEASLKIYFWRDNAYFYQL